MRRIIALIIMLIVPLQSAWSAAAGLHGHVGEPLTALGFHSHEHSHDDHHQDHSPHSDQLAASEACKDHNEDGHHGNHCHPVFSSILMVSSLTLVASMPSESIAPSPVVFLSRTPPPLDRPPLALA